MFPPLMLLITQIMYNVIGIYSSRIVYCDVLKSCFVSNCQIDYRGADAPSG